MRSVFFSYCHEDEALRDQLEQQLAILKRQLIISTWHDRRIIAGSEIDHNIDTKLEAADIILLLISPAFLASDYCYDREMTRAMERHHSGDARVIPVILRPCDWHETPFGKLLATPIDGKPVTLWPNMDQAFLEVAKSIKAAAKVMLSASEQMDMVTTSTTPATELPIAQSTPRSSNLRLAKQFTERDRDVFKTDTFEYLARFFEHSLNELMNRNPGIEGEFRRIDANRFFAVIYQDGRAATRCTIYIGSSPFANGIAYSTSQSNSDNSYNECLSVDADDQALFLKSMGMSRYISNQSDSKLSQEGAAELYWGMLIKPLQHR